MAVLLVIKKNHKILMGAGEGIDYKKSLTLFTCSNLYENITEYGKVNVFNVHGLDNVFSHHSLA